jgi:hypothetical protein
VLESVDASNGLLLPRISINFIARPQINLGHCTGPLRVYGQSNQCTYVRTAEMLSSVREIQVFVPSRHEQFDCLIANTVTRLQSPYREMMPLPTPKQNAGKCNRGCYAHFNEPPVDDPITADPLLLRETADQPETNAPDLDPTPGPSLNQTDSIRPTSIGAAADASVPDTAKAPVPDDNNHPGLAKRPKPGDDPPAPSPAKGKCSNSSDPPLSHAAAKEIIYLNGLFDPNPVHGTIFKQSAGGSTVRRSIRSCSTRNGSLRIFTHYKPTRESFTTPFAVSRKKRFG